MVYDRSRFLVSHRKDCQAISTSFIVIVIRLSFLVGGLLPINIVQFYSIFVQRLGAVGGSYNPAHALYIRFIANSLFVYTIVNGEYLFTTCLLAKQNFKTTIKTPSLSFLERSHRVTCIPDG